MRKILFCSSVVLLAAGCERSSLSPVDIKIDENIGYTAIGDSVVVSTHIVAENETLFDIANKYNIDPINLANINHLKPPYKLKEGQILRLPTESFPSSPGAAVASDDSILASFEDMEKENENPDNENGKNSKNAKGDTEEKKKREEINEEFAELMTTKGKATSSASSASSSSSANAAVASGGSAAAVAGTKKGTSFKEQEEELSSPKIKKTVTDSTPKVAVVDVAAAPTSTSTSAPTASKKMIYPVKGKIISGFGDVKDGISNEGINISAPLGTPVKSAGNGEIIYVGNKFEEFGNTVIVQHDNGLITSYAHLKDMKVKDGDAVHAGDIIGSVGRTGDVADPQLHFEVLKNKTPVDPTEYVAAR